MQLEGKKGIIFGIANSKSIAWGVAQKLKEAGASFGVTYLNEAMEKRVVPLAEEIGADFTIQCDLMKEEEVQDTFKKAQECYGKLDFVIHSVAYANKEALSHPVYKISHENFQEALGISAWTLLAAVNGASELLNDGASVVTMSYYGAVRAVPNYGIMGVAKAALEAEVRYLSRELGERDIRINAISAGPIRTLAAAGIKGFKGFLNEVSDRSAIQRNLTIEEVGDTCTYLVSPQSSAITGQTIYVDMGFSALG